MNPTSGQTPLASGRVAELYDWGAGRAVKLWRRGGQADAAREARMARAAFEAGAATPQVFDLVEVEGRAGIVFERVDGPTMVQALTARPWTLFRLAAQLAAVQAGLHRCPAPTGLHTVHQRFEHDIRRAAGLDEAQKAAAIGLLNALPGGERLCHGDLHPDNVLMSPRGPVIVDWANAALGPPLADVARTAYLLRSSALPASMPILRRLFISLVRELFFRTYLRQYASQRPVERRLLSAWAVPVAAARLSEGIEAETSACAAIVASGIEAAARVKSKGSEA